MTLESLAQDVSDKAKAVDTNRIALFEAEIVLSKAKKALTEALCDSGRPTYNQVAINLLYHVVVCKWNGDSEYGVTFISKASNENP